MASTQQQRVLDRAREGDPKVICGLLNHKFAPAGITTTVRWQERDRLLVGLTANSVPELTMCLNVVERAFKRLEIPQLAVLAVSGYRRGEPQPQWQRQLSIASTALALDLSAWSETGSSLAEPTPPAPLAPPQPAIVPSPLEPEQRYLSFTLGIENPGLLVVETIQEILYVPLVQLLPVPDMPSCVVGIHNWRGEMLWVVDLNYLLGLGGLSLESLTTVTIIVLRDRDRTLGLMVRTVGEILAHSPVALQPPVGLFRPELERFIEGYLRASQSIVLNTAAIFDTPELHYAAR